MRRLFFCVFVSLCLLTPFGFAQQTTPAWEIFGGYSIQHTDVREYYKTSPIIYTSRGQFLNQPGWELSISENMNRWFSGTFDVSGHYRTVVVPGTTAAAGASTNREQSHTIMYGPRFSYRTNWVTPFGSLLFGGTFTNVKVTPTGPHASDITFAVAAGGGVDVNIGKFAVRPVQIEYIRSSPLALRQNGYRGAVGVVYHLGKK